MTQNCQIILASSSPFRRQLLENAGLKFTCERAQIDERSVEQPLKNEGVSPEIIAQILAQAKADEVSKRFADSYVIGSDQTLSLGDELLHKVDTMEKARHRLLELSGKTHQLNVGVVLMRNQEVIWSDVTIARLSMRKLSPHFIGRHLSRVGEKVLSSVGAYQIEGEGIQLFDGIEGDIFTIMGLPLLPLLNKLRELEIIDA